MSTLAITLKEMERIEIVDLDSGRVIYLRFVKDKGRQMKVSFTADKSFAIRRVK